MIPSGFITRPTRPDDLAALLDLINRQERKDYGEPTSLILADLEERWASAGAAGAILIVNASDQPVAFTWLYSAGQNNHFSARTMINVAPELRGQGLEAAIVDLAEQQALTLAPAGSSIKLSAIVTNQPAAATLEQMGYAQNIAFQTLMITLQEPPAAPTAIPGIELRPFVPGRDEQAAYEADEEASLDKGYGQPKSYAQWTERLNLRPDTPPRGWFLAWDGAEVAGGIFCEYLADSHQALIHHLGVRRAWRGKGLGKALMEQVFGAFYAEGITTLALDVDTNSPTGAQRLYSRCGMQVTGTRLFYEKLLRPGASSSEI